MTDLNVMMREHALAGLNAQLDAAVTNGDTEAARKVTKQIADMALATAPQAPPYGQAEIRAAIEAAAPWFGVDPKKSAKALELGKDMNPKKFPTAEAFATALLKAVDEEFKPAGKPAAAAGEDEGEEGENTEAGEGENTEAGEGERRPARRASDGPRDTESVGNRSTGRRTGPWTKLSEAPADVQKEVKRAVDKFVPASASKEQREGYIARALESHYSVFQRNKGKK